MKTAEIRACQPQEGLCGKGCRHPGATVDYPGLVRTGGQEFGRWVRFSCGSDQPPPLNCPLSVVGVGQGESGAPGLQHKHTNGPERAREECGPHSPWGLKEGWE